MQMTMRWFGAGGDSVTLEQIRQVSGVTGVVASLYKVPVGTIWEKAEILGLQREVENAGLTLAGIESLGIHDSIKTGSPEREQYLDNYIISLERLGEAGIRLICYNFMPVFDWIRSDLAKIRNDGATAMSYEQKIIDQSDPYTLSASMNRQSNGYALAGWEPERLHKLDELLEKYQGIDEEQLFANLAYFLERIMPTCEKYQIKMAIHPDDPPWSVFGLPRIITGKDNLLRLIKLADRPFNGVTLCTGSLGSNPGNDIPDIIHALKGRIHFVHVRNVRHTAPGNFEECAHFSGDGSLDMFKIMKTLYNNGFDGPIRPDHGRAIWGEIAMPGYGLYDRALGASYLIGLWEAIEKIGDIKCV
ncbi:MAG: mannonate dehydratase [Treponema sp.]|jgi:mannonate dehydratase|nr:mannonate dehydratase [Treponema sp.]